MRPFTPLAEALFAAAAAALLILLPSAVGADAGRGVGKNFPPSVSRAEADVGGVRKDGPPAREAFAAEAASVLREIASKDVRLVLGRRFKLGAETPVVLTTSGLLGDRLLIALSMRPVTAGVSSVDAVRFILSGEGFDIRPDGAAEPSGPGREGESRRWRVVPRARGARSLVLGVEADLEVEGMGSVTVATPLVEKMVFVEADLTEIVYEWVGRWGAAVAGAGLLGVALWLLASKLQAK